MARKLYPLGIQTFERIRTEDRFYVDKTEYIYNMVHTNGVYVFLSRPRRFGKSLLVSTLQSYFEGRKELFKGLAMEKLEKEWTEYPVLHFDLSGGKHQEEDQLNRYLDYILKENERRFGIECDAVDANVRLANLISSVYNKTGKQVVVLIDEYDAPLLDVVHQDEKLEGLRYLMRNFYSPLKQCEPMLRFVFLTGITKFSQLSIFSELNNINNISMDEEYAGICGITEEDIDRLADKLELTREKTIETLKYNYDGYHFTWPSPDIFNPYSLLNCFSKQSIGSYWFGSGTPTFLIEMMRKFEVLPSSIGNIYAKQSSFDAPTENMTSIIPLLSVTTEIDEGKVAIARMSAFINKGDIDGALNLLQTFLATVPYCENTKYEGHYQQMLYIIFALLTDYRILVEQRTAKGRTDITMETEDHIYIMELKFGKTADEALAQINANHYADAFAMSDKKIVKVGIGFDIKDERNITEWRVE